MENQKADVQLLAQQYCRENELDITLCFEMPAGWETANGMWEPQSRTLFFNRSMLEDVPAHEQLFFLYHELRHAAQHLKPEQFDSKSSKCLAYVIGYDGECWKRVNGTWQGCRLEGSETFFTQMYLGQPYEMDANAFAYQQVKALLGDSEALEELYSFWQPEREIPFEEYEALYEQIDRQI